METRLPFSLLNGEYASRRLLQQSMDRYCLLECAPFVVCVSASAAQDELGPLGGFAC